MQTQIQVCLYTDIYIYRYIHTYCVKNARRYGKCRSNKHVLGKIQVRENPCLAKYRPEETRIFCAVTYLNEILQNGERK